jgi:hypothetical protein
MDDEDRAVLKGLGIKTGVTYSVVPVACTQEDCIYYSDCQDNAVGLTEGDKGVFMVCHDYKTSTIDTSDKKVYFMRKVPK